MGAGEITPFGLRMPPELRAYLKEVARRNHRSLNNEIICRLEKSIPAEERELLKTRKEVEEWAPLRS